MNKRRTVVKDEKKYEKVEEKNTNTEVVVENEDEHMEFDLSEREIR